MFTEDKVTELFCMADDFCKFFDEMTEKYTLKSENKRPYHRDSTMSKAEIMLIMMCCILYVSEKNRASMYKGHWIHS